MDKNIDTIEKQLLLVTRHFLLEQQSKRALHAVSLDASLERQLGIDSLGKVELFHRIEQTLGVRFTDQTMAESDTLKIIAKAALTAKPGKKYLKQQLTPILETLEVDLSQIQTLPEVLIQYALTEPDRPHIYLPDEQGHETVITYGELLAKASSVAHTLIGHGIQPNDTVAIMLPTGPEFFESFMGVLLVGAIPVPIYPPLRPDRIEEYAIREARILNSAEVRFLITFTQAELLSKILQTAVPSLKAVLNAKHLTKKDTASPPKMTYSPDQPALIQYTSGSTGDPKGVLLLHSNILANLRSTNEAITFEPCDTVVSWLPLYHDMGLMSWVGAMFYGIPFIALPPISFLNRPERWLWSIHYHRATISAAPNFAYELCVKRVDEALLEGLDLSSWRLALNGAEAVHPETLERFYQKFKAYGFKKESLFPVYGLAENTVALAFPEPNKAPHIDKVDRDIFENERIAKPSNTKKTLSFVCEGKSIPNHDLRIVDDENQPLAERHVGNIQFSGPSAMQGYYRNPEATKKAYHEGWWDTGDLGYLANESLYVTGRRKDLIIKAGRNLYPETIESVVGQIAEVRKGCVVAFGAIDPKTGTERIVVVAETRLLDKKEKTALHEIIIDKVSISLGVPPDDVVIAPPHTIPKTSSGKLQRAACKDAYLKGKLAGTTKKAYQQMLTLFSQATWRRIKNLLRQCFRLTYTFYMFVVMSASLIPFWLPIAILPKKHAPNIIKAWAKTLSAALFCPIKLVNKTNLTAAQPVIYCANHASYSDVIVMLATLPTGTLFTGKKELLKTPFISTLMKKLNYISVDRQDFSQSIEDSKTIKEALLSKRSIMIFPEGTFSYASGLRTFKSGAFQLSVETEMPICPIAIRNTRKIQRGTSLMSSPQKITMVACKPIMPKTTGWAEIHRLSNEVRHIIAEECGEPMIEGIVAGLKGR